jgi:hypothetical protein
MLKQMFPMMVAFLLDLQRHQEFFTNHVHHLISIAMPAARLHWLLIPYLTSGISNVPISISREDCLPASLTRLSCASITIPGIWNSIHTAPYASNYTDILRGFVD